MSAFVCSVTVRDIPVDTGMTYSYTRHTSLGW
jgi:hypothetical protein